MEIGEKAGLTAGSVFRKEIALLQERWFCC